MLAHAQPTWCVETALEAPAASLALAYAEARQRRQALLVMLEPLTISDDALGVLSAAVLADPHFGAAIPRVGTVDGRIRTLIASTDAPGSFDRRLLAALPDHYLLPECVAACMLLRRELVAGVDFDADEGDDAGIALLRYLHRARRCGYRVVVANRAVAFADPASERVGTLRSLDADVFARLQRQAPTLVRPDRDERAGQYVRFERQLAAWNAESPSLLIDARNVGTTINGTAQAVLELADALHRIDSSFVTTIVANGDATRAHGVEARYPRWRVVSQLPDGPFTLVFRASQPWAVDTILELHRRAPLNVYWMLDTIAWDVGYTAPPSLDASWRMMADTADGLAFLSRDAQEHFERRFGSAAAHTVVTSLSVDPAEYRVATDTDSSGPDLFVVGNAYDHKALTPTVELLAAAFPFLSITVLGGVMSPPTARVTVLPGGKVPEAEVQRLFATARVVVFPSYYEGFGLPMVSGLAYGKDVIVRRSQLAQEILESYRGPGRVLMFDDPREMVELVGGIVHGEPAATESVVARDVVAPAGWDAVAARVTAHLQALARGVTTKWLLREERAVLLDAVRPQAVERRRR